MRNHLLKVNLTPVSSLYRHSALNMTTLPKLCNANYSQQERKCAKQQVKASAMSLGALIPI
ncbi:hypothetical protein PAXRUDRAFT_19879 [Paxillus rubicundulus Ve08.2h10]|uniref:Uncharacterized protein n=1 Tax=Paxillus rubicundulus Ve08.2h10 TaxID=930991 RepID=A0A0D0BSP1_9AGAM|nr:hypothetical protein PAXRUDRAFT_19879 [Paxillus rubicundulus Ve08.2h10]